MPHGVNVWAFYFAMLLTNADGTTARHYNRSPEFVGPTAQRECIKARSQFEDAEGRKRNRQLDELSVCTETTKYDLE